MWDGFDSTAVDGLLYLEALAGQPVRPSAELFQAFLNQPRPEKKSLKEAVKATRSASGSDVLEWMLYVGWVEMVEADGEDHVDITPLGSGVATAARSDAPVEETVSNGNGRTRTRAKADLEVVADDDTVDDATEEVDSDDEVEAEGSEVPAEAEMAAAG